MTTQDSPAAVLAGKLAAVRGQSHELFARVMSSLPNPSERAALVAWMQACKHLPQPLRDFHDQKAVFKAMHAAMPEPVDGLIKRPDWVAGQCYVIDVFLRFMAQHGYTLQRSRHPGQYLDLATTLKEHQALQTEAFRALIQETKKPA